MKKTFCLDGLDCPCCAAKMEEAVKRIDGVDGVSISFMTQTMTIEADADKLDEIVSEAQKRISRVDGECRIKR